MLDKAGVQADDFVLQASAADQIVSKLCERNWAREKTIWAPK